MGKFWCDSLVHDEKQLQNIIDLFGEDKVCCGSDYPFPLGEMGADGNTYSGNKKIVSNYYIYIFQSASTLFSFHVIKILFYFMYTHSW